MNENYQLGISQTFPCSYLPDQQERLLIAVDERLQDAEHYGWLMSQGFRRSGDQIYRPHCINCRACQSLRVLAHEYVPTKSQKRLLKKNGTYTIKVNDELQENYYPLYKNYINEIHKDGAMYPANYAQYQSFLSGKLTQQLFLEIWHDERLISVAVTDILSHALSAVYTFYHPDYRKNGIGAFSIIQQILLADKLNKKYLYLGYQIDDCQKMNYKNRYYPHQLLKENSWKTINK
ncbi:arginyltransferase [Thalassotalea castellviae]|uniref:Aspartate/glutamate leucyltransferase n=1 Tax=Thalassotalea castellviae TaxID=3075612 RepID=A0ABU2ZVV2_9GAMM|nr:arginyltransferase [Thalassotalea sp. W431]MDT0602066.1 arginyltransferase [Thalassotalea sp. W431]